MMAIGTLALTGFPFTAGYYLQGRDHRGGLRVAIRAPATFAFLATVVAAFMTSFYSWRLFFLTFEGRAALGRVAMAHDHAARRHHEGVEHDDHSHDVEPAAHARP